MGLKILVCGGRNYQNYQKILHYLGNMDVSLVISGGCRGADFLAVRACRELGLPFAEFKADWKKFGRSAGPIRNAAMLLEKPDLILAFHPDLGKSRGTRDMVLRARKAGIPVRVID